MTAIDSAGQSYEEAAVRLRTLLAEHRDELPADAVRALDESLRAVDRAIERTRTALAEHPGDSRLAARLSRIHRQRLRMLEGAVRLATDL